MYTKRLMRPSSSFKVDRNCENFPNNLSSLCVVSAHPLLETNSCLKFSVYFLKAILVEKSSNE